MSQQTFSGTVPPTTNSLAALDANFTELYRIWNQAHFDGSSNYDRQTFNGSAGSYVTFQYAAVAAGDIGTASNIVAGGSAGDFALSSRAGNLDFGTGSARRGRFDTAGNLLIGRTAQSSGGKLEVAGNLVFQPAAAAPTLGANTDASFQLVSNTQVKLLVRGSDGVTRSVTWTLA